MAFLIYEIMLIEKAALAPHGSEGSRLAVRMFALRHGGAGWGGWGLFSAISLMGLHFKRPWSNPLGV